MKARLIEETWEMRWNSAPALALDPWKVSGDAQKCAACAAATLKARP
jgi:hypothetical protein